MTLFIHALKSNFYLFTRLVVSLLQRNPGFKHCLPQKKPATNQKLRCLESKQSFNSHRRFGLNDDFDRLADQIGYTTYQNRIHLIAELAFEAICLLTATQT